MALNKTVIEWPYEPPNFFETPFYRSYQEYELHIQDGRARATLKTPVDPVPTDVKTAIQKRLEAVFAARRLCTHLAYTPLDLESIRIYQHHSDGHTNTAITLKGSIVAISSGSAEFVLTDSTGRILRDSKAERITEQDRYIDLIVNGDEKHPLVSALWRSYGAAVNDPADEFIHLFEIRDALKKHFGDEQNAKKELGISDTKWKRLGILANSEPVEQSRHRGQHLSGRRPASQSEIEEARSIAKELIEKLRL